MNAVPMDDVDRMASLVRRIAERGAMPGEGAGRAISRVARRLGLSQRQATRLWNRDRKVIPAGLMEKAEWLADEPAVKEARHELSEIDARIARLEALLVSDEEFYRVALDAERAAARGLDSPMDRVNGKDRT